MGLDDLRRDLGFGGEEPAPVGGLEALRADVQGPPPARDEAMSLPTLQEAYSSVAEPVTQAVGWAARRTPMATLMQVLTGTSDETMDTGSRKTAEMLVPQTPTGAGATLGMLPFGGPVGRVLGAAGGAALGSAASGNDLATVGKDAGLYGAVGALGEGASAVGSKILRSLPWMKGLINEGVASGTADVARTVNPALGPAIETAREGVSPMLKGGTTAAALQEMALGSGGKNAMSDAFRQGMLDTTLAAQGQGISSPAMMTAWRRFPSGLDAAGNVTDELAHNLWRATAPDPSGMFSPMQAERILAELGEAAFKGEAASPIARGMGGLALRDLYRQAKEQAYASLPQPASGVFEGTRRAFAGGEAITEGLRQPQAFQGLPNRIMLNTPSVGQYLSTHRAELEEKLGADGFRALTDAILAGGQVGTRDILTPGSGSPMAALAQVYGRGQGGAPQIVGSAVRTALPNLGSEATGRSRFTVDPGVQALLDYLGVQAADQFQQAQNGTPIKIGPTYGR